MASTVRLRGRPVRTAHLSKQLYRPAFQTAVPPTSTGIPAGNIALSKRFAREAAIPAFCSPHPRMPRAAAHFNDDVFIERDISHLDSAFLEGNAGGYAKLPTAAPTTFVAPSRATSLWIWKLFYRRTPIGKRISPATVRCVEYRPSGKDIANAQDVAFPTPNICRGNGELAASRLQNRLKGRRKPLASAGSPRNAGSGHPAGWANSISGAR